MEWRNASADCPVDATGVLDVGPAASARVTIEAMMPSPTHATIPKISFIRCRTVIILRSAPVSVSLAPPQLHLPCLLSRRFYSKNPIDPSQQKSGPSRRSIARRAASCGLVGLSRIPNPLLAQAAKADKREQRLKLEQIPEAKRFSPSCCARRLAAV